MQWNEPVDVNSLDDEVLNDVLLNLGIEPEDVTQKDIDNINKMSAFQLFDRYLTWNGIIGYTHSIIEVIENLQDAQN